MAQTQVRGTQVRDATIQREDLDAATPGSAVIRKALPGSGIRATSTGPDVGTGDVTITNSHIHACGLKIEYANGDVRFLQKDKQTVLAYFVGVGGITATSGLQTITSYGASGQTYVVPLQAGDIVIYGDDASAALTGVWLVSAGSWTRHPMFPEGAIISISDGSADQLYGGLGYWDQNEDRSGIIDVANLPATIGTTVGWIDGFVNGGDLESNGVRLIADANSGQGGNYLSGDNAAFNRSVNIFSFDGSARTVIDKDSGDFFQLHGDHWYGADVATTGNIALSGTQTIDGITIPEFSIVLVWQQDNPIENGIYVMLSGAWARTGDISDPQRYSPLSQFNRCSDVNDMKPGRRIDIFSGTQYGGRVFEYCGSYGAIPGTDPILFRDAEPIETCRGHVAALSVLMVGA